MFRLFAVMMLVLVFAGSACTVASESDGPSEPVSSIPLVTTEAGSNAVSISDIDPLTCAGVLVPVAGSLSHKAQALTSIARESQPQIESMCSAMYDSGVSGGEFLSVVLMKFDSGDSAVDHYESRKGAFIENGFPISELNNASEKLTDQFSVLIDSNGVGRTTVMRRVAWVVSITVGPSMDVSMWVVGDMEMIGRGVLGRVN